MTAIVLCVLSFGLTLWGGKRSLGWGLTVLLVFGYFYGILRANLLTTFSHFIFDCGLFGLYLSQTWIVSDPKEAKRIEAVRFWTIVLVGWCLLVFLLPFQPWLVALVGLRGNAFFIPMLILGSRLKQKDLIVMACGLAALNVVAGGFAILEYFQGIERFYPRSPVTEIIFMSGDVAGGYFRIPAIFSSAHAYGGTMVDSLPYLIGAWSYAKNFKVRILTFLGAVAALMGILASATRLNFILGSVLLLTALAVQRQSNKNKAVLALVIAIAAGSALLNARFQRFKSLSDTSAVTERLAGSVNRGFFEILEEYPMGNGLGGGGTSIPYFLASQVRNPIGMENEYARILCEQGIIGLLLWIGFVAWFFISAKKAFAQAPWANSRRMIWCLAAFGVGTMWAGVGFLTAIPQTLIQLLGMGWTTSAPADQPVSSPRPTPAGPGRSIPVAAFPSS